MRSMRRGGAGLIVSAIFAGGPLACALVTSFDKYDVTVPRGDATVDAQGSDVEMQDAGASDAPADGAIACPPGTVGRVGPLLGRTSISINGTVPWQNVENALVPDDASARANTSNRLAATDDLIVADFRAALPPTAVIRGITATVHRTRSGSGAIVDHHVHLANGSTLFGDDQKAPGDWKPNQVRSYGGATDTWDAALAPSDFNEIFGVGVAASLMAVDASASASIDAITVTIDYACP